MYGPAPICIFRSEASTNSLLDKDGSALYLHYLKLRVRLFGIHHLFGLRRGLRVIGRLNIFTRSVPIFLRMQLRGCRMHASLDFDSLFFYFEKYVMPSFYLISLFAFFWMCTREFLPWIHKLNVVSTGYLCGLCAGSQLFCVKLSVVGSVVSHPARASIAIAFSTLALVFFTGSGTVRPLDHAKRNRGVYPLDHFLFRVGRGVCTTCNTSRYARPKH